MNPTWKEKKSSTTLTLFSPAKINLFFRLKKKRQDGFHDLESLFQTISLKDDLSLTFSQEDTFSSNADYLSFNDQNLIIKALNVFRDFTKVTHPLAIHLKKNIPIETGLGGGSSNAATLLWGLNLLFKTNLSLKELFFLAAKVSSDSSFFFSLGTALCEGRGESVKNLKALEPTQGWIVKPPYGISTPKAYALSKVPLSQQLLTHQVNSFYTPNPLFQNDLESSAFEIEPELKRLKQDLLDQGCETVFMTGSGSGLICLGKTEPKPKKTIQIYPFHYINRRLSEWYLSGS